MRIVFDVDDTICNNNDRDYINAIPKKDVITKINQLYDDGIEIVLYTSRGMKSCNGDINKIIEKNKKILENWLLKHNVKYTELIFGKPLGDLYIDDKAMNVNEFIKTSFHSLKGGSNTSIYKLGNIVKKDLCTEENLKRYKEWVKESKSLCLTPNFISNLYNEIYIEYIEGTLASEYLSQNILKSLILQILKFSNVKYTSFNLNIHLNILNKNKNFDDEIDSHILHCEKLLKSYENELNLCASFSHSDCILSNIIIKENQLYFIDCQMFKEASSYLLDFAKLRMSLDNYEYRFNLSTLDISKNIQYKTILDETLKKLGIFEIVIILEYMYILRLYRYKSDSQKKIVKLFLNEFYLENQYILGEVYEK